MTSTGRRTCPHTQRLPKIFSKLREDISKITSIVRVASYHICVSFNDFNHFDISEIIFSGIILQFVTGEAYSFGDFFRISLKSFVLSEVCHPHVIFNCDVDLQLQCYGLSICYICREYWLPYDYNWRKTFYFVVYSIWNVRCFSRLIIRWAFHWQHLSFGKSCKVVQ